MLLSRTRGSGGKMKGRDYSAATAFLADLFEHCSQAIELRACHNEKRAGAASLMTENDEQRVTFCEKHDRPEWGTYFGATTRRRGAENGSAEFVAEAPTLWVDIDCAKQGLEGKLVLDTLASLPFPPTHIVNSGGGLHAWWKLEEPASLVEAPQRERFALILRSLAHVLAGDLACAEVARIMRLPGTMNSKAATLALYDGEPALCEVIEETGRVYDLGELAEWLETQRVLLQGSSPAKPVRDVLSESDPFVRYAREAGYEPAIDIEAALAAMGDGNIHGTQLSVSASMLARGYDDDEIVATILAATERCAPRGERWNWTREERKIRDLVASGRRKGFAEKREAHAPPAPHPQVQGNAALAVVHDLQEERAKREPKPAKESKSATVAVGKAAIGVWQERHGPVMHTGGQTYAYEGGVWNLWDERLAQRLRAIIQEACASLGIEPKTSLLGAARAYFMDRPELVRHDVRFDEHGLLVAADACLDLATFEIVPHSPEHYATRKSAATLQGERGHPELDAFLAGAFSDRPEADAIISTLQEFFGASIVPLACKQRALKKGLFAHGPSRSSKTQISELMRFLLGHERVCGTPMRGLEDRFGTEPLIGKYGWIADDAVGEGEFLDADIYKVVVTGEQTSTKTKGGKNWEGRFGIPVLLTANNLPRVKDQSDAVYNRSLILPMTVVRPENAPEPAGYESIADLIGKTELTGLLWWAIEGWQRLARRGTYDPPPIMLEANKALKDSNNPVQAWMKECVDLQADSKVLRADLLASMNGWSAQEFGADAKPWSGRGFFPKLTALIPGYSKDTHETADVDGNRMVIGVALSKVGLLAWRTHKDSRWGENSHTSPHEDQVNKDHAQARMSSTAPPDRRPRF